MFHGGFRAADRVRMPNGQQFRLLSYAGDDQWWARPWMKPMIKNLPPLPASAMTLVHRVTFNRERA